ncbi:hypothetical protein CANMA_004442 [Candida margitis]|uniref:uncharacterized protein n=1 Tax=Candida margitis TaxID=1775924 RepID=UPI002226718A|nr:uncharacterized protein CANMA_004442 [Candida margitis]KAI5957029.1 hypothetical protein CANMA_004442 [Candida margitis]
MKHTSLQLQLLLLPLFLPTVLAKNVFSASEVSSLSNSPFNCSLVTTQPYALQCQYVKDNCNNDSVFNYYNLYYCDLKIFHGWALIPLLVSLAYMFVSLGITASEFLCPNLHTISKSFLKIPDNLAGLTILAFGNSAPDIFGTYEATKMGSINLALAELVGASLFISSCVIGCIGIIKPFEVPQVLFKRDVAMYFTVYTLILLSLIVGKLSKFIAITLIGVYICYVSVAVYSHKRQQSRVKAILRERRSRGEFGDVPDDEVVIDEIYLDGVSQLPTIDDINVRETLGYNTNSTGNFGLRKLMEDLSLHSNLGGAIQLDTERQLMTSLRGVEPEEIAHQEETPHEQLVNLFCPQLSRFRDKPIGEKLRLLLLLPISLIVKVSTPVRTHANMLTIEQDYKPNTAHNVFNYSKEKIQLVVQTGIGCFIFLSVNTHMHFIWKLIFHSIASLGLAYAIFRLYPTSTSSSNFPQRMSAINYFVAIFGLVASITWVSIIATEIINILQVVSTAYRLSDDFLGITLFALGNSVGDFITNYTIAQMGFPVMAFAACFGSPLMALCSFGFSGLIIGGNHTLTLTSPVLVAIVVLFSNMVVLCVKVPRNSWKLDRHIGIILIGNWTFACLFCLVAELLRRYF